MIDTTGKQQEEPESAQVAEVVSDAPAFALPEDQFDYWRQQFQELAERAAHDGIDVVACFSMIDPIQREAHWDYCCNTDHIRAKGLLGLVQESF